MRGRVAQALALLALAACTQIDPAAPEARILAIGDSVLAWHGRAGAAVPDVVGRLTGMPVANLSVSGARISTTSPDIAGKGGDIRKQYRTGAWDWVILNGGANDLLAECGCRRCDRVLDSLVGAGGQGGDIRRLIDRIVSDGAKVVLLGYYDGNVLPNPFSGCGDAVDILNARLEQLALRNPAVAYVAADTVIDPADPAHWFIDRVHPSRLGSRLIGARIAATIKAAGG